jgi:DNA-binding NarL/FixJ family response regulator
MLVDDHLLFAHSLKLVLRKVPDIVLVEACSNGKRALEIVDQIQLDVALVDMILGSRPEGVDVIAAIAAGNPAVRTIAISGHPELGARERALAAGANAFLGKTANVERLVEVIRRVHRGDPEEPEIASVEPSEQGGRGARLTERELEILRAMGTGKSTAQIAAAASISESTVRNHIANIRKRCDLRSRAEIEALAARAASLVRSKRRGPRRN